MPHLTIEYTNNLPGFDARNLLVELNRILAASGHFDEIDIKSRAIAFDTHVIGTEKASRAFVHAKLAILSGRSPAVKREISERLLQGLKEHCPPLAGGHIQFCAEILDIDRDSYSKSSVES